MSCACAIEIYHEDRSEMIFEKTLTIFKNHYLGFFVIFVVIYFDLA